MLVPRPALDAFRRDLGADALGAGPADARWLQAVTLLQQALEVPATARAGVLDAAAVLLAHESRETAAPLPLTLPDGTPGLLTAVLRAGAGMEDAARFHMAAAACDAALRLSVSLIPDETVRDRFQGTVLAVQGRIARMLGDAEAARELYAEAGAIGRRIADGALRARAWVGEGSIAQMRGNLPAARKHFMQALAEPAIARESLYAAHQALMVMAGNGGDHATAARHGWTMYELAESAERRAAALCDLGEVMRRAGRPLLALRAFLHVADRMSRSPRRLLAALGGIAVAAAESLPRGEAQLLVDISAARIAERLTGITLPWHEASAAADLGDAYALLGDTGRAARHRAHACEVAERHGFFELLYHVTEGASQVAADSAARAVRPPEPMDSATEVLAGVAALEAPWLDAPLPRRAPEIIGAL